MMRIVSIKKNKAKRTWKMPVRDTKGSLRSQRSIIEIHSLNRTVLINERSIKDRGNIGVVKGHQLFVMKIN